MNALSRLGEWLGRFYDRLLAVLMLALLAGAVGWAAIQLGRQSAAHRDFGRWLAAITPDHPQAAAVVVDAYAVAEAALGDPPQLTVWSNALLVPETRCWCVDCLRPITLDTDVCPFCGITQPPDTPSDDLDSDFDGIPDAWEIKYGLDPRNAENATRDTDGDGFTDLEEYLYDTDPTDPSDHPPFATKLELGPVRSEPFRLQFKSTSSMPDGGRIFAINTRDGGRTYFVKLGDTVEDFEVHAFEEKFEERTDGGVRRRMNLSVLTLRRQGKLIPLTMGREQSYVEYRVSLVFALDQTEIPITAGETFAVRSETYRVKTIDIRNGLVVVERLPDGQTFDVRKPSQAVEQTNRMP